MPVKIELLGAHLQAYRQLSKTINTLRVCHRYGQGSQVNITRLPPELIETIADLIITEARQNFLPSWTRDFRCFRYQCEPVDHFDEKELQEWHELAQEGKVWIDSDRPGAVSRENITAEERVRICFAENMKYWESKHNERAEAWEDKLGESFDQHAKTLHADFGLEVWMSHVRARDETVAQEGFWDDLYPPKYETTVAYLVLPGARTESESWGHYGRSSERNFIVQSGYGMRVQMPQPLSDDARGLFQRAMAELGLKPFVLESQKDLVLSTRNKIKKIKSTEKSAWPQLMLLTGCKSWIDDEDEV